MHRIGTSVIRTFAVVLLPALVLAMDVSTASAAWPTGDVDVCLNTGIQRRVDVVPDGVGGVVVGWFDNNYDQVYAQRYDAAGNALWTANGIVLPEATGAYSGYMPYDFLVPDGQGGVLFAWHFNYGSAKQIRAQRVDASGNAVWLDPVWGTPISTVVVSGTAIASTTELVRYTSDGAGGLIFAWHDTRGGGSIYAQRVDSTGTVVWPSGGVPVYTLFPAFGHPWIEADGSGGAFIAWDDKRQSWVNPDNVYMQRVDAAGNTLWQTNGVPVMDSTTTIPYMFPRVMSDGAGGAYVAFRAEDNLSYPNSGWATGMMRILGDGTRAWSTAFIDAYGDAQPQEIHFDMTVPSDGGILWAGSRAGDLAAFRLDAQGAGAWNGTPGVPVSARAAVFEQRPSVSVDSSGVTHVLFSRSQFVNADSLFAYQLDASGTVIDSTHVNSGTYVFPERADVTSLSDGAVYAWVDQRNGESDVFARMAAPVSTGVTAGATPPIAHLSTNWPNPFSIDTRFDYTLDATARVDLAVYDVAGRRVRTLATGPRGSGAHRAAWDGADGAGHHVASGVYFVRLRAGGRTAVRRMTVVR